MAEQADVCSAASRLDCHMAAVRMDRLPSHPFHLPFPHTISGDAVPMVEPLLLRAQVSLLTLALDCTKPSSTPLMRSFPGLYTGRL